jgi:CheY-like chemotaxis protein
MDRRFTTLIAEDDARVRDGVVALLREHGFVVLVAEDGDAALRLLVAHEVDLLLTDVAMPGINGFEIAQQAKSMRPGLRLLCMTGYAEEAADKGILYGKVIQKPFGAGQLLAEITQALAG